MAVASFFRVEGALSPHSSKHAAAWLAANAQYIGERLTRLTTVALSLPLSQLADPTVAARISWSALRKLSDDRIRILGEEYFATHMADKLNPTGVALLERARSEGHQIILLSDNLDAMVRPLAKLLNADDLVCNRMGFRRGVATGRLTDPVFTSKTSGQWLRHYADSHGIDLSQSCAYGATTDDATLLSAIGRPCTISPDRGLRRLAKELDWPIAAEEAS
jgi:phosphoserine phosphatase